jgi:hypothetical protein
LAYDICTYHNYGEHAKTNGLITYEEALHTKLEDIVKVPKNIYYHKNGQKYNACMIYKTIKYESKYTLWYDLHKYKWYVDVTVMQHHMLIKNDEYKNAYLCHENRYRF